VVDTSPPLVTDVLPGVPAQRLALDAVLARMRVLALGRFTKQNDALEAFFEEAARLARDAWPEVIVDTLSVQPPADDDDDDDDDDVDDEPAEEVPTPADALAALLEHLDQLEELMEALGKQ
jgi:hypothetical protein